MLSILLILFNDIDQRCAAEKFTGRRASLNQYLSSNGGDINIQYKTFSFQAASNEKKYIFIYRFLEHILHIFSIFDRFFLPHLAAAVLDKFVAKLKINVSETRERKKLEKIYLN